MAGFTGRSKEEEVIMGIYNDVPVQGLKSCSVNVYYRYGMWQQVHFLVSEDEYASIHACLFM